MNIKIRGHHSRLEANLKKISIESIKHIVIYVNRKLNKRVDKLQIYL